MDGFLSKIPVSEFGFKIQVFRSIRFGRSSTYNFKKKWCNWRSVVSPPSAQTTSYYYSVLGFLFAMASILYIPYVIWAFVSGTEISGWASLIMTVVFFGGLHLVILGVLGIYIGKIFKTNKTPPWTILSRKKFFKSWFASVLILKSLICLWNIKA